MEWSNWYYARKKDWSDALAASQHETACARADRDQALKEKDQALEGEERASEEGRGRVHKNNIISSACQRGEPSAPACDGNIVIFSALGMLRLLGRAEGREATALSTLEAERERADRAREAARDRHQSSKGGGKDGGSKGGGKDGGGKGGGKDGGGKSGEKGGCKS